jgi:adenosylcobinamide-phosphate synthase
MELQIVIITLVPLAGFLLDFLFGDPFGRFHPIALFGTAIYKLEKLLNRGKYRIFKGAVMSVMLIAFAYLLFYVLLHYIWQQNFYIYITVSVILFFFGIASRTLINEVRDVFKVLKDRGIEAGRLQVARIVGRDTSQLDSKKIKIAALETLAENLSDGVVAPLFWFAIAGIPGMFAYKMINTLDSMIAYKSERYLLFGRVAAYIDDIANYIPARLTAFFMFIVVPKKRVSDFILRYSKSHASPNAGFPESAMAAIIDCRFGGPNIYHNKLIEKPYIGITDREPGEKELKKALFVSRMVAVIGVIIAAVVVFVKYV